MLGRFGVINIRAHFLCSSCYSCLE